MAFFLALISQFNEFKPAVLHNCNSKISICLVLPFAEVLGYYLLLYHQVEFISTSRKYLMLDFQY